MKTCAGPARPSGVRRASWYSLAAALLAAMPPATMLAQTASTPEGQPAARMSVKVKVVNVLATVRDKHGKIVPDLTADDFVLTEDGRPQKLHYFAKDTDLPLTLGLLVDTSFSQREVLGQERDASRSFLNQMVREDQDKAFIIHFDREAELLQDLTPSHEKLSAALDNLETPQLARASGGGGSSDPDPDAYPGGGRGGQRGHMRGGGTVLYDSIYLASDELMSKQQGRKAVIVLSDGVDRGSKESLESAIAAAQKANTMVYAIYFKGEEGFNRGGGFGGRHGGWGGGMGGPMGGGGMGRGRYPREEQQRPDGKKILERISQETGGRLFEVSKKEPVEQIYASIEEELRNQYNLGFTPDSEGAGPGYHKIELTTKKKDLTVQTRQGFYVAE